MKSLLFVCTGNICRSPFAEHIAKKLLPASDFLISSSGLGAVVDGRCPSGAVQAAKSHSVILDEHRGRQFEDDEALLADAIIVMNEAQLKGVHARLGAQYSGEVVSLAQFCPGPIKVPRIPDPYGCEKWAFESCYALIADCLGVLAKTYV